MIKRQNLSGGIPIAISLQNTLEAENVGRAKYAGKKRILFISALAVAIAVVVSLVAKFLVYLINFFTGLAFHGQMSIAASTPQDNTLGLWVIVVPAVGGIIIGLMAFYGSKAIRGHGIPEAMEQILTNDSKIRPAITYLKPLSSAISIGTGGPFGAEGPIISTGGALGSTLGQITKISHYERKVLLAAGATAGMSAIFGSPIAAIFLAIELLLFEFSPSSIIPVALACITGAAGHHVLFEPGPVFPVGHLIDYPSNEALFAYSIFGIVIGLLAVLTTRAVYYLEDLFDKLPVHWMWWPAIGGVIVGLVGYFDPRTLGVGYDNITHLLSGSIVMRLALSLFIMKFISWSIALASGTSGGTLAPLLTIGAATGALLGIACRQLFPEIDISISLSALVGMSAMFAGASRALLTSIIFALETTGQANALLPLLAACSISYFMSIFLMENTIMTEKIARRGVKAPGAYKPDVLEEYTVQHVMSKEGLVISEDNKVGEVREWLKEKSPFNTNYFIIVNDKGVFSGIVSSSTLFSEHHDQGTTIKKLLKGKASWVGPGETLKTAVEMMVNQNLDLLPVINNKQVVIGTINYRDILNAYKLSMNKHERMDPNISLKRQTLKLLAKGHKIVTFNKE